jgi:hypothetical protein
MLNKYIKSIFFLTIIFCLLSFLFTDYCQASILGNIDCAKKDGGTCTLNDFVKVMVNLAQFILGITGSLALLMFIYGGVLFLISAGNPERITQAKKVITGAVIGIVIVFASYTIIGFVMIATGFDVTGTSWSKAPFKWTN